MVNLQDTRATAEEMTSVVVCVKPNQVAVEYAEQNLVTNWQDTVDFGGGEGGVKEEANLDVLLSVTELFTQHGRHEHKMVIVDPDHIVVLNVFCDCLCEQAVGFCVALPG